MTRIIITRRWGGSAAYIEGSDPLRIHHGRTFSEAIGGLVMQHTEALGLEVHEPEAHEEPQPEPEPDHAADFDPRVKPLREARFAAMDHRDRVRKDRRYGTRARARATRLFEDADTAYKRMRDAVRAERAGECTIDGGRA